MFDNDNLKKRPTAEGFVGQFEYETDDALGQCLEPGYFNEAGLDLVNGCDLWIYAFDATAVRRVNVNLTIDQCIVKLETYR